MSRNDEGIRMLDSMTMESSNIELTHVVYYDEPLSELHEHIQGLMQVLKR